MVLGKEHPNTVQHEQPDQGTERSGQVRGGGRDAPTSIEAVTVPYRTGEARQWGVSQCIIIACLQKLSMKLAIVQKKSPPAKTSRDKRLAYFSKALLRYGGGQLPVPHPICDMFIE